METEPRTVVDIESAFCYSLSIVSTITDMITSIGHQRMDELANETLENMGHICWVESQKVNDLFHELQENHCQSK